MNDEENWNGVPLAAIGSGLYEVPRGVRPTVPIDLESSEPGAAAAYRMRQAVKPDFGRPGNGPTVRGIFDMTAAGRLANTVPQLVDALTSPGSPAMRDIEIPRKSNGPSLAEILGATPAESAENPNAPKAEAIGAEFGEAEPKRPSNIQNAIDSVNKTVDAQRKQLDQLGRSLARGAIDKKEYDQRRIGPEAAIGRADAKISEIDAPFQRDYKAWETRKNEFLTNQSNAKQQLETEKARAERPFRQKYPEATNDIIKGGNALTAGSAALIGALSRGKLKPTLGAMGLGGVEGAVTANVPEMLDLAGQQPIGGPGWQKTLDQMTSKENLVKTGAEAGIHAAAAGGISYGTSFGPKISERVKSYFAPRPGTPGTPPPSPGSPPPTTPPNVPLSSLGESAGAPSPSGPVPSSAQPTVFTRGGQTLAKMPDGTELLKSRAGWHGEDGRLLKKSEWPTLGNLGKTRD